MNKEQKQFLLSSLFSGIMIGIGCTVYLSCVNKLVGALLFCAGLFFILTNGGTLFTGICGLKTPVKKLAWVFVLNGLGTVIPAIVSWSNVVDGATKLGATAAAVMLGKLGIDVGDFVCFDPRSRITESGYIKSRFLDDKLSVGILQAFAQYLKDENLTPKRRVYVHVTVYEEVGHGGSASVPDGVTEAISVDMGCVGEGVQCTERQVSICAKDSGGPYSYDVVRKLIAAAKREGADYAVDVYPHYGSDVEATLRAGYDIRHGLIGAGVYASHGYERSHRDGALNTLKVIEGYLFE